MAQLELSRLSYSTLSKLDECPARLFLTKGTSFPSVPSWASVGGRACHSLFQEFDLLGCPDWTAGAWSAIAETIFLKEIVDQESSSGIPSTEWRASKAGAEGRSWWERKLPGMGELYQAWRLAHPELTDWVTPDGEEAVELEISIKIPGVALPFLGYIDKIMIDASRLDALVVIDYKSGSWLPEDLNQYYTYASLLEIRYGIRPEYGATYDARKGELAPLRKGGPVIHPLHRIPTDVWIRGVQERERLIETDVWPAKPSKSCGWCDVRAACVYGTGERAMEFDPHHPYYKGSVKLAA